MRRQTWRQYSESRGSHSLLMFFSIWTLMPKAHYLGKMFFQILASVRKENWVFHFLALQYQSVNMELRGNTSCF